MKLMKLREVTFIIMIVILLILIIQDVIRVANHIGIWEVKNEKNALVIIIFIHISIDGIFYY